MNPKDSLPDTTPGAGALPDIRYGLAGRRIVVTGAAQGIGEACARRLAAEGARLELWDVCTEPGEALAAELRGLGVEAAFRRCDVSSSSDVQGATAGAVAALGGLDGLINNAGIFRAADFLEMSEADWDAVIAVNLKGSFLVGQAVARVMASAAAPHHGGGARRAGRGAIVNMSSVNGVMAIPSIASYNASKGGIDQLTRVMALSLADHSIRVNAVAPGTIATELAAKAVLGSDEARQRILGRTPMRRLGEPAEVADAVAWLLCDASSYLTGEIVYVDGGRRALNYSVPVA